MAKKKEKAAASTEAASTEAAPPVPLFALRDCPKCGSTTAVGPRYRGPDEKFPVPRLLYACSACHFVSADPTLDATDEEKRILAEANQRQLTRVRSSREVHDVQPVDNRSREIREIFGAETRRRR